MTVVQSVVHRPGISLLLLHLLGRASRRCARITFCSSTAFSNDSNRLASTRTVKSPSSPSLPPPRSSDGPPPHVDLDDQSDPERRYQQGHSSRLHDHPPDPGRSGTGGGQARPLRLAVRQSAGAGKNGFKEFTRLAQSLTDGRAASKGPGSTSCPRCRTDSSTSAEAIFCPTQSA